jgi:hypothetical protein
MGLGARPGVSIWSEVAGSQVNVSFVRGFMKQERVVSMCFSLFKFWLYSHVSLIGFLSTTAYFLGIIEHKGVGFVLFFFVFLIDD